jgi:hypothetical protein
MRLIEISRRAGGDHQTDATIVEISAKVNLKKVQDSQQMTLKKFGHSGLMISMSVNPELVN